MSRSPRWAFINLTLRSNYMQNWVFVVIRYIKDLCSSNIYIYTYIYIYIFGITTQNFSLHLKKNILLELLPSSQESGEKH